MSHSLSDTAEYLVSAQNSDGSWGAGDPFVCARVLYAIKEMGGNEGTLSTGLGFLENSQASDGHFPLKSKMYSDAANTAYALIVLNQFDYGKASISVSRGIIWLLEHQDADGSWGGNNKHKRAYTTALCLRALHTFYLSGIARFDRGLDYVIERVNGMDFAAEPVSHVYAPILHLQRIGYLDDALKSRFIDYSMPALKSAIADGQVADVAYLTGTLNALGEKEISATAAGWLVTTQKEDGGYGKDTSSDSDPNWSALVILSLRNKL
ncbi:MAG TPA: prenyltransferase/squalene oxidase repeat-containing protein [Methanocellaceae archaeon]|jgi:hypothetical protein